MQYLNKTKNYRSQAFVDRIEANLANISSNPNDEFKLVKAYYDITEFDCELCGHKHCVYAFEVENLKTHKHLKVGSECIHHFKGKGVDIDLAEGLMKRVIKATAQARKDVRDDLAEKAWNEMTKEEKEAIPFYQRKKFKEDLAKQEMKKLDKMTKRQMLVDAYMVVQAKELLSDVARNKHILSEDEIQDILDLGLEDDLERSRKSAERRANIEKGQKIENEVWEYIEKLRDQNYPDLDEKWVENKISEYEALKTSNYGYNPVKQIINDYKLKREQMAEYAPIMTYKGTNEIVLNIKNSLTRWGRITDKQKEYAFNLIEREKNPPEEDTDFEIAMANLLLEQPDNEFFKSVASFYKDKGYVSPKQRKAIMKAYDKINA